MNKRLTINDLYDGICRSFEHYHAKNIRDRQGGLRESTLERLRLTEDQAQKRHPGDNALIAKLIDQGGAGWMLDDDEDGDGIGDYDEANKAYWCGAGAGGVMAAVGDHLVPGRCIDLRLRRDVGKFIMPSCSRLNSGWSRDAKNGKPSKLKPLQVMGMPNLVFDSRGVAVGVADGVRAGQLATCWTHSLQEPLSERPGYGDHVVILAGRPVEVDGELLVPTYECNGYGWLGNGKWGEGVVKRTPERRPDLMRPLSAFRRIYQFDLRHFEGAAIELFERDP